jgi:uncharacterized protein YbcI
MSMLQLAPAPGRSQTYQAGHALTKLAACFATQWRDVHNSQATASTAQIVGNALVLTLTGALTSEEQRTAGTESGRLVVISSISRELDRIYPKLASEIERVLHCYVGELRVDVDADSAAVTLQLQLHDAPGF